MLKIKGNDIYITRGDDASLQIDISDIDGKPYVYADYTTIVLTVKSDIKDTEFVFQKIANNAAQIYFIPHDTAALPVGRYVYDVTLTCNGKKYTIIAPSLFVIEAGVTNG